MMRIIALWVLCGGLVLGCDGSSGLEILPLEDQEVGVNDTLLINLVVLHSEGDERWGFSAPSIEDIDRHAQISQNGATAVFRWSPLANHVGVHQFTFTVSSGGNQDSETISIEVTQEGGAPVFIQPPSGGTFDLARDPCVDVEIEVIDADSVRVDITEVEPIIDGGEFTQGYSHRAEWHWCPTPQQIDETLRYTLYLEADDGDHDAVAHRYDIVLISEERPDCPGERPEISNITPNSGERLETIRDYEVTATITDDQGFKDLPVLYYSTEEPNAERPDITEMDMVTFEVAGDHRYRAFIPNLNLEDEQEQNIYFVVSATDNDDAEGTGCDHTTRSSVLSITAVEPTEDDFVSFCEHCSQDRQCQNGVCVAAEKSFCGSDCGEGGSCSEGTCQGITSRGGEPREQCVPEGLQCQGGVDCTDDDYEDANDSMDTAPDMAFESLIEGQICPGDADYYSIDLVADQRYEFTATGWNALETDIDIALVDGAGFDIALSDDITDVETFTLCVESDGEYFFNVFGYSETTAGVYLAEAREVGGTCCVDDSLEDDDYLEDAHPLTCAEDVSATLCPDDDDWWSITVSEPSTFEVMIFCSEAESADLDLQLYDADGLRIASSEEVFCEDFLEESLPVAGTYYLRVYGYTSEDTSDYDLSCIITEGATCDSTFGCPSGTVCGSSGDCIDEVCDDPGSASACPSGHFCPEPGGIAAESACADDCTTSLDCRAGYDCKIFEEGRGCARSGEGETGQACESFADCADERTCLTAGSDGYCAEINCESSDDCPEDSLTRKAQCVDVGDRNICLMNCISGDSLCDSNPGTCTWTRSVDTGTPFVWVCALDGHSVPEP